MKAFVLAAGLGTRLLPLTTDRPKVMVEVGGKKILERTIGQLVAAGVNNLVINTHYFPQTVTDYFGDGSAFGVQIDHSFEPTILGTSGGLKNVEEKFSGEKEFLVVYGDNVYNLDFSGIVKAPLSGKGLVVLFNRFQSPNSGAAGGVVEIDVNGYIKAFWEGVQRPDIPYVNAGIYKFTSEIFSHIPAGEFHDFGKQVFPDMLEQQAKLSAYVLKAHEAVFGVDTIDYLEKAKEYFSKL